MAEHPIWYFKMLGVSLPSNTSMGTGGENIVFSLDPRRSRWVGAGFGRDSHWWVWDVLGYSPEEASHTIVFPLRDRDLHCLAGKYERSQWGWSHLNISKVTNMERLFAFNAIFNEPITNWDTGKVSRMQRLFLNASRFNQDLGGWNISEVVCMDEMFLGSGMSSENLSKTLVGWAETARKNGVKKKVILSRLPCNMNDLSKDARSAIRFLVNAFEWKIGFSQPTQQKL